MTDQIITIDEQTLSNLVLNGNLSGMSQVQKIQYYKAFCDRLGLDPITQPFKILKLQGKEVLYCDRSGAQQLNKKHNVSHEIRDRQTVADVGVYSVVAKATLPNGRFTESIGAVAITGLKGEAYANAIMKAETKAKRRATLDLLGLGILDETETDTIPEGMTLDISDVDELHNAYITLYNEYVFRTSDKDSTKYHPDNWKGERNAVNYTKAIEAMKIRLNGLP